MDDTNNLTLPEVIAAIEAHHMRYRDHEVDCACMDKYIQRLHDLFLASKPNAQPRVDFVILQALSD